MRFVPIIMLLVCLTGWGSETWYVDPSASASTEDGTTTNPYKSLNAALAGKCNKTFTTPIQIRCRTSGSVADTTTASDAGLVLMQTSGANYLQIIAETGHRAGASWDATKYNLSCVWVHGNGTGVALKNTQKNVFVDGLQISCTDMTGADEAAEIVYWSADNPSGLTGDLGVGLISNCLIRGPSDSSFYCRGISVIFGVNMYNTVIYGMGGYVGSSCVKNHGSSVFYSCTFNQGAGGIICVDITEDVNSHGTCIAKNCYASNGTTFHAYDVGSGTLTMTTCASSDSTGSMGLQNITANTSQFVNVTPGSENWRLVTGSALRSVGTDTSGDSAPFNFTVDIEGDTRGSSWDIGADQFQATATYKLRISGGVSISGRVTTQ